MTAANARAPLEFLSTHPAGEHRIREIEKHLPEVVPLYERARRRSRRRGDAPQPMPDSRALRSRSTLMM